MDRPAKFDKVPYSKLAFSRDNATPNPFYNPSSDRIRDLEDEVARHKFNKVGQDLNRMKKDINDNYGLEN